MATQIGIGFSQKLDTGEAARDAVEQAKSFVQSASVNIAIVFSTIHYDLALTLQIIKESTNNASLVGCSTAGIITSSIISLRGISVLIISSDDTHFSTGLIENLSTRDMRRAGNLLARNVIKDYGQHRRQAFVYFADGLSADNSLLLRGIQDVYGNVFPIVGAGSSDDFHFKKSFQFCEAKCMTDAAAGFLMGGHLTIGIGSKHGWKPLGKPHFVDRSEGNVIKSIDGKFAASIYDEYFGEQAQNLRSTKLGQMSILYPLGIYIEDEGEYLLRNAVNIRNDGSIVCQGEIPENAEVNIMISNKESCIMAATDAALSAQSSLKEKEAKLVIIFESLARQKLLGRAAFQEVREIKEIFGVNTPIVGMYSYGEICPSKKLEDINNIFLQNESITILAIG